MSGEWRSRTARKVGFKPGAVFAMMSFVRTDSRAAFRTMSNACSALGLELGRVDDRVGGIAILEAIKEMIAECQFIICDITGERPNVYYELGYAHGLGHEPSEVLLLAKTGTKIHFDLAGYKVAFYSSPQRLAQLVKRELSDMVISDAEQMPMLKPMVTEAVRAMAKQKR